MPNNDGTGPMGKGPGIGAGRGQGSGNRQGQGSGKPGSNNGCCGQGRGVANSGRKGKIVPKSDKTAD